MAQKRVGTEPLQILYSHLAPRVSQLLYCLAKLEHQRELVTREKLANMLGITLENVSNLITQLKSARPNCLYSHPQTVEESFEQVTAQQREPGRPVTVYHLDVRQIITLPKTARIALDAFELSREPDVLTKTKFINRMVDRYAFSKAFITERLEFCLNNFYLTIMADTKVLYPAPSGRIINEQNYLNLLAADCKQPRVKTGRRKRGGR